VDEREDFWLACRIQARLLPPPPGLLPGTHAGRAGSGAGHSAAACRAIPKGRAWSGRIVAPGPVTDAQLRWLYANAAALVATSYEDFGLTPVEAFGFGTPVVALRAGGYLDSCVDGVTRVWVEDPSVGGVVDGLRRFRSASFDCETIIAHGAQWSPQHFAGRLAAVINEVL